MNGVDYTKKLAAEKDLYQKTIQKDREYTQKRLSDEEERHGRIQKEQSDHYQADLSSKESSHKKRLGAIGDRTQKSLAEQKAKFNETNEGQGDRFHKDRENLSKQFDSRFRDIQDSYRRNTASEREQRQALMENDRGRYQSDVSKINADKDAQIKEYREQMAGSGSDMRSQYDLQKRDLNRSHDHQVQTIFKDEVGKRADLKDQLQTDIRRMRESHAQENEQSQRFLRDKVGQMHDNFEQSSGHIANDYAVKNGEFVAKQAQENKHRGREHQNEVAEVRRTFDNDLRGMEIEARRKDLGSGEFKEIVKKQQGLKDDQVYKSKISRLRSDVVDQQNLYSERRNIDAQKTAQMFQDESVNASHRLERTGQKLTADKIVAVSNERERANLAMQGQQAMLVAERGRLEHQISLERDQSSEKIEKLKVNFSESLRRLEESNGKYIEEARTTNNLETGKVIASSNQQRNEEIQELRKNFTLLMQGTVDGYEQRLKRAEGESIKLREQLDQKVAFVSEEADRKIEAQARYSLEQKKAGDLANSLSIAQRDADQKKQIRELTTSYGRKMERLSYEAEVRLKNTVSTYENKLKEQQLAHNKLLSDKVQTNNASLVSLRKALEHEKAQVITQYENEIQQVRNASKEQVDKLNEYKNMG